MSRQKYYKFDKIRKMYPPEYKEILTLIFKMKGEETETEIVKAINEAIVKSKMVDRRQKLLLKLKVEDDVSCMEEFIYKAFLIGKDEMPYYKLNKKLIDLKKLVEIRDSLEYKMCFSSKYQGLITLGGKEDLQEYRWKNTFLAKILLDGRSDQISAMFLMGVKPWLVTGSGEPQPAPR